VKNKEESTERLDADHDLIETWQKTALKTKGTKVKRARKNNNEQTAARAQQASSDDHLASAQLR
jgi:hypothetical protein